MPSMSPPFSFESMEDKIRGEEVLLREENRRAEEERKIKKELEKSEVDRKLEELRKRLNPDE